MAIALDEAVAASAETDAMDFKAAFEAAVPGAWCGLVKDMVAIGNSGGGAIVIGVDRNGKAIGVYTPIDARRLGG